MRTTRHGFGNEAKVSIIMNLIFGGQIGWRGLYDI